MWMMLTPSGMGRPSVPLGWRKELPTARTTSAFTVDVQGGAGCVTGAGIDPAAEGQGVIFGEDALAHDGGGDGHGEHFGQLHDLLGSAGGHCAATGVEDREAGVDQHVGGALDLVLGGAGLAGGADRGVGQHGVIGLGGHDVLGHFEDDRAGRAGAQGGEGAAHDLGDVLDAGEGAAPLAETIEDAGGDFLLPLLAEVAQGVLAHEEQHGDVVGVAAGDAGEAVGCAGAGAGHGDADLAGGAGVAVGDLDAEAFVAGGEGPDAGGAQGTPEGVEAAAGESGYVAYSFLFEGFDDGFGSTHGCTSLCAEQGPRKARRRDCRVATLLAMTGAGGLIGLPG